MSSFNHTCNKAFDINHPSQSISDCKYILFLSIAMNDRYGDSSNQEKKITELERQKADLNRKLRGISDIIL